MKTALVLSGGGAKGAFQAGALAELHDHGFVYQNVVGVSVGVLNSLMVASGQIPRMIEIWNTISRNQVYSKRSIPLLGLQYLAYKIGISSPPQSIYSNAPLFELLKKELKDINLQIPLTVGRVNLESGDYINIIHPDSPNFSKEVLASTAIPVIWQPVMIDNELFVDGGIRNMTPLKDAIHTHPDRIIVITNRPLSEEKTHKPLRSIADIAKRSLDILMDEVFVNDLQRCIQINQLVQQAEQQNIVLTSDSGEPLTHYELILIEPPGPLGDMLNFDRNHLSKLMKMGRQAAKNAIQTDF